jgi:hypothetical protein
MPFLAADSKRLWGMQRGLLRSTGQKHEKLGAYLAAPLNDSRGGGGAPTSPN